MATVPQGQTRTLQPLERLGEALVMHTNVAPDASEGQAILKDKFITLWVPDIRRKLQTWATGPKSTLENLLKVASSVFYTWNQEEEKRKNK